MPRKIVIHNHLPVRDAHDHWYPAGKQNGYPLVEGAGTNGGQWGVKVRGKIVTHASKAAAIKYADSQPSPEFGRDAKPELSEHLTKTFGSNWHQKGQSFPRPKPGSKEVSKRDYEKAVNEWRTAYGQSKDVQDHFSKYDNVNGHVIWRGYATAAWEKGGGPNPDVGKAMIVVNGQKKLFPSLGHAISWARENKA